MDKSVKISDGNHKILIELSKKTKWSIKDLMNRALENYFAVKKFSSEN